MKINKDRLLKKFGFIPKIRLYNKDITSDGCFSGNSKVVLKYLVGQDTTKKSRKHQKAMWVYRIDREKFKIQIADVITKEEFWIDFEGTTYNLIKFFKKLKRYPIQFIKLWEKEVKNVKVQKLRRKDS